ncbi:ribonuclease HII [Corynebacterium urogenitale]|uniref:ribonuclease HII n=1 Tax=Corynebacterium urogenitale TaxID=2487892 RepID=UPI001F212026
MEHALERAALGPVAGVDEAGRGACCGPISIAACILPAGPLPELDKLTDSKKLSAKRRDELYGIIRDVAVAYSIVHVSASEIDVRGIQPANLDGMRRAVAQLAVQPGYVLTDAMKVPGLVQPHLPVLKGDQVSRCISAASVLAKVSRDRAMVDLDTEFPGYGLAGHKGYGTAEHMRAVSLHGGTPHHRYTYKNVAAARAEYEARQRETNVK